MIQLNIKNADGSHYWTHFAATRAEAEAWLAEEETRKYWVESRTAEFIDLTPPPVVISPDEQVKLDRLVAYNAAGVTIESMIVALWEKIVEGKDTEAQALQAKRQEVKVKHPKVPK